MGFQRQMKGEKKVFHDLFKLQSALVKKNHGYIDGDDPDLGTCVMVEHEHTHVWHSVDSSGKPQEYATWTAGHTHKIDVVKDEEGNITEIKVGPPITKARYKKGKKIVSELKSVNHIYEPLCVQESERRKYLDFHEHQVAYIHSEEIQVRQKSTEAALFLQERLAEEQGKRSDVQFSPADS